MRNIITWNRNLGFFTNSYNYVAIVLPVMIVAPMFMRGEVELGVVTQSVGAFAQVLAAVSLIITQFGSIKNAHRIYVMRQGEVVAEGTHEELLESSDYYAELARLSFTVEKMPG
jgi:ABC-type uncharacterized transport system fused permease/ATPase subunit